MRRLIAIPQVKSAPLPIPVPTPTLSANTISSSEIDLTATYAGPPSLLTLTIQRALAAAGPWTTIATQAGLTLADTPLAGSTQYFYRCNAQTNETLSRTSAFSAVATATTQAALAVPGTVTGVTVSQIGPTSLTLSWNPVATATQYVVYQAGVLIGGTQGNNATSFPVTGLSAATQYSFTLKAFNLQGYSAAFSAPVTPTTAAATAPGAMAAPVATVGSAAQTANVAYVAPADNGAPITGYNIRSGDLAHLYTNTLNNPATMTALTAGLSESFQVQAINIVGPGPWSPLSNAVIPTGSVTPPGPTLAISIAGNKFVNGSGGVGATLQPRGYNVSALEYADIQGDGQPNDWEGHEPNWAALKSYGCNTIRIPLNAASLLGLTTRDVNYTNKVGVSWGTTRAADQNGTYVASLDAAIRACQLNGMYAMPEIHWSSPQWTFGGSTGWASPQAQMPMMDLMAKAAYLFLANRYGTQATPQTGISNFGVLFGGVNEPFVDGEIFNGAVYSASTNADIALRVSGTASRWGDNGGNRVNQSWQTYGYNDHIKDMRATGCKNPIGYMGNYFGQELGTYATWLPTDTLNPPQIFVEAHLYASGNYPYGDGNVWAATGNDPGSGTSSYLNPAIAVKNAGYPVVVSEAGGTEGANYVSGAGEKYCTSIQNLCDANGIGLIYWEAAYVQNFSGGNYWWNFFRNNQAGTGIILSPGQGEVSGAWLEGHAP